MANRWTEGPSTIDAANYQRQEQLPWKPLLELNVGDACPHAHVALNVLRGWIRVVDRRKGMLELRIPQLGMHLIQHGRRQLHQLRAATHSQARWCVAAARIS